MAGTFVDLYTRITTELRRTNATANVKQAINDAIEEAAKDSFYFNQMMINFNTVAGQEYYSDQGLVEIEAIWYFNGPSRYNVDLANNLDLDDAADGNNIGGQLLSVAHDGGQLRLYPIPSTIQTIYLKGYGKLTPFPLVNDTDANAWLTDAEMFIRALAKRNFLRDVVRDYGEARVYDTISQDYKAILDEKTAAKMTTGNIRSTQF